MTRSKTMFWGASLLIAACGGEDPPAGMRAAGAAAMGGSAGAAGAVLAPTSGSGGAVGSLAGSAGNAGAATGTAGAGAGGVGGGSGGQAAAGGGGTSGPPPASCAEAARPYQVSVTPLDAGLVPVTGDRSWAGATPRVPVAVDGTGAWLVGFTRQSGTSYSAVIAREDSTADSAWSVPDAALGGLTATKDGAAALRGGRRSC